MLHCKFYLTAHNMPNATKVFVGNVSLEQVSRNIEEAMLDEHWKMVVHDEMKAFHDNNTWEQTTLPDGKKTV